MSKLTFSTVLTLTFLVAAPSVAQTTGRVFDDGMGNFRFVPIPAQPVSPAGGAVGTRPLAGALGEGPPAAIPLYIERDLGQALERIPQITVEGVSWDEIAGSLQSDSLVEKVELPAISFLNGRQDTFGSTRYDNLRAAAVTLQGSFERNLATTAMSTADADMMTAELRDDTLALGAEAVEGIVAALKDADPGAPPKEELRDLVQLAARINDSLAELPLPPGNAAEFSEYQKSVYANSREYAPHVYRAMVKNTQGAVGIGEKLTAGGGTVPPHCSGALIGPKLVLTARHCLFQVQEGIVRERPAENLRVIFDFESDPALSIERVEKRVTNLVEMGDVSGLGGALKLDYAVLEIDSAPTPPFFLRFFRDDDELVADRQICLTTQSVHAEQEVYVVGHPEKRERTVADAAHVLFPYRASTSNYGKLAERVITRLHDELERPDADAERIAMLYKSWTESYIETPSGSGIFLLNSAKFGGQPTIGIQANTSGGNSGGPVMSKLYKHMVGILRGGSFDFKKELIAGWEFHEGVLPIELVIEDMNVRHPGWQEQFQVCAWGKNGLELWSDDPDLNVHCNDVCR